MPVLDTINQCKWAYAAGTNGTVTVPAGYYVIGIWCHASASGASLAITPGGAAESAGSAPSIPVPAGSAFSRGFLQQLGPGTSIVFTSTDGYFVDYSKNSPT